MAEGKPGERGGEEIRITKEEVIARLRKNPDDLSHLRAYFKWWGERQAKTARDNLLMSIEEAEIYRDAGMIEAARGAYEQAAEQAYQEHDDELCRKLLKELEGLK